MTGKRPGRVGDSPLPGCGTYADDRAGAASATGTGEAIMRVTMARVCTDEMRRGASAAEAAAASVRDLAERTGLDAGIICIDARGGIGVAKNTETMPVAYATLAAPEPVTEV
jgi:beta-aspartyl-peptidase (threonine type)